MSDKTCPTCGAIDCDCPYIVDALFDIAMGNFLLMYDKDDDKYVLWENDRRTKILEARGKEHLFASLAQWMGEEERAEL